MPSTLAVAEFSFGQRRFDVAAISDATGDQQARLFGPPRWTCSVQAPGALPREQAVVWQTMLLQLRGRINHLAVWDRTGPSPRGTMRGTLTLNSTVAAGATSATITGGSGQANTTLKAGDKLQFASGVGSSQLVQVTSDAVASGSGIITVTFEPPARIQFGAVTAVTWDRPVAYFKVQQDETSWRGTSPEIFSGFGVDLLEAFS